MSHVRPRDSVQSESTSNSEDADPAHSPVDLVRRETSEDSKVSKADRYSSWHLLELLGVRLAHSQLRLAGAKAVHNHAQGW